MANARLEGRPITSQSTAAGTEVDVGVGARVGVSSGVEVGGGVGVAEEQAAPDPNNTATRPSIALLRRIGIPGDRVLINTSRVIFQS